MEIHKPHAAKTGKEFFIELATITAGILIALALEQLVEYVHWQHEVEIARQSIRAEMAANNDAVAPCVDRQIREADAVLTALEERRKAGMTSFRPPPTSLIRDSEWESERASQVLTHFPRGELAIMAEDVGRIASEAGVKTLVLSHFVPSGNTVSDQQWLDAVKPHFSGTIVVGRDLMEI